MRRESPSTQMSNQLTRRDFAIRTAGFGLAGFNLAMGLAPAATLAKAEQASRAETSLAVATRACARQNEGCILWRHHQHLQAQWAFAHQLQRGGVKVF